MIVGKLWATLNHFMTKESKKVLEVSLIKFNNIKIQFLFFIKNQIEEERPVLT